MSDSRSIDTANDTAELERLGYHQELHRRMSGFSNFAISLSIICILAGGVTSFAQGFCAVGGAAIGIGWPLCCLFSLTVAATMGQIASAFPTAGGLYHWAAILGGRGWGWLTAWFNLAGLICVLAAINAGLVDFVWCAFGPSIFHATEAFEKWLSAFDEIQLVLPDGPHVCPPELRALLVAVITTIQAIINHRGIRLTSRLTDFSGWWILGISAALIAAIIPSALNPAGHGIEWSRLVTLTNFSGAAGGGVLPESNSLSSLFLLGLLLPAYTITGFDASAHVAEETIGAAAEVPRGIVRSVWVSGLAGWIMLCVVVLSMPSVPDAATQGGRAFAWTLEQAAPHGFAPPLLACIAVAQFLCGLATVTSASRMTFAFARDGGLPCSALLRQVSPAFGTPVWSIWFVAIAAILLTAFAPYSAIAAVCVVLLYISYVLPTALGAINFGGRWTKLGPWHLGRWYRPLAMIAAVGTCGLLAIGVQPPNEVAIQIIGGLLLLLAIRWFACDRDRFTGPPQAMLREANRTATVSEPLTSATVHRSQRRDRR